jgi:F-type H+-transporting ATPase subunit gamma
MSQLMQMRRRIQAVQSIKKITHAMRLISMSTHARMKNQEAPLNLYQETINNLITKARFISEESPNRLLQPDAAAAGRMLIILVGSQKGLCGNFNAMLMHRFEQFIKEHPHFSLITVGKRARKLAAHHHTQLVASYDTFGTHNLLAVAKELLRRIAETDRPYGSIYLIHQHAATFFLQKPKVERIIPVKCNETSGARTRQEILIEQSTEKLSDQLTELYLLSHLQHALFESLIAEHAARFISMDHSTRNAEALLEDLQLNYNKLRQANITKELTELSAFFLQ